MFEVLKFLAAIEIVALVAYPFERSFALSKPLGLALLTSLAMLLSFAGVSFSPSVWISFLILAALSAYFGKFKLSREALVEEAIFVSTFLLSLLYLSFKPEIYFAFSEDFTDFAFLKSILKYGAPLKDPWFGGEGITYYFFGHAVSAAIVALSGVEAETGYNLAVAMYYSMAVQLSFWLGRRLTGKTTYAIFSAFFVCLTGFLSGFLQLAALVFRTRILDYEPANSTISEFFLNFDFSAATWAIPGAVVFYPFFTFLQGDMHAHFMSLPFQLAFASSLYLLQERFSRKRLLIATFLLAFLSATNVWAAFPGALLLLGRRKTLLITTPLILLLPLTDFVGIVEVRTSIEDFLQVFATFFVTTILFIYENSKRELMAALLTIPLALLFDFHLLILLPIAIALLRRGDFSSSMAFVAVVTILFCEVLYFNDPLGKPFERMNTVMKLYLSAWAFWGISSAVFMSRVSKRAKAIVILLAFLSLIHPLASMVSMPNSDLLGKTEKTTLDGMEWLKEKHRDEYEAIKWLENKSGLVLEAPGSSYSYSSRVSTFTGLPTVIGWKTHEIMWGRSWEDVEERVRMVDEFYRNGSLKVLEEFEVKYVFFGEVERIRYGKEELKHPRLKLVYEKGSVRIYEVLR